jgi:hypothetical protein
MLLLAALLQTAACPATPAPPPPELAGWTGKAPIAASAWGERTVPLKRPLKGRLLPATLPLGQGATASVLPSATLRLAVSPGKPPTAGTYGGMLSLVVPAPGRYRIALGAAAWLDLVRDGKALTSVAPAHGPACTGIRKMVDFDLRSGRYLLQIAGSPTPAIDVMVAQLPGN